MEVITPNSPVIKKLKTASKSEMFIRVGRADSLHFSRSASLEFGLKQFDKVQFVKEGTEVWARIVKSDGFIVSVDGKNNSRICDTALVRWICQTFRRKPPFRLNVLMANERLFINESARNLPIT